MHVLSSMMLLSMSFDRCSCGDHGRVLPTSIGVVVFLHILAARASVNRIHSLCQGVNGGWFVMYGADGPGDCGPEGIVESGYGVEAVDEGSEVIATRMMLPD